MGHARGPSRSFTPRSCPIPDSSRRPTRRLVAGAGLLSALGLVGCTAEHRLGADGAAGPLAVPAPGDAPGDGATPTPNAGPSAAPMGLDPSRTEIGITITNPSADDREGFIADLEEAATLGMTWVRFAVVAHDVVDGWGDGDRPVELDEDEMEALVWGIDQATARDLRVCLMTVDAPVPDVDPETSLAMLRHYWEALADALAPGVPQWQIFNEPDGQHFQTFEAFSVGPSEEYLGHLAECLSVAREVIHSRNPDALVTTNLYGFPVNDATEESWVRVLDAIARSIDVITLSAYPQLNEGELLELPERIQRLEERYGLDVVIGEIGLQTCEDCFTEQQQASAFDRYLEALAASRARVVFFYELRDSDGETGEGTFGVLRADGTEKPAHDVLGRAAAR